MRLSANDPTALHSFIFCFFNQDENEMANLLAAQFGLWGNDTYTKLVYLRNVYKERCNEILGKESGRILIGGSKGIGKSIYGLYLVLKFLKMKNKIVLYQRGEAIYLLIPHDVNREEVEPSVRLLSLRFNFDFAAVADAQERVSLFKFNGDVHLMTSKGLVYVCDQDETTASLPAYGHSLQILVSSPNTIRLSSFTRNEPNLLRIYLPVWSFDEIKQCYVSTERLKEDDDVRINEMKERFRLYGGIPRMVMDFSSSEATSRLAKAIAFYSQSESLAALFSNVIEKSLYEKIVVDDSGHSALLVHQEPVPGNFHEYRNSFASAHVAEQLLLSFNAIRKFKTQLTFHHLSKSLDSVTAFKAALLEGVAHDVLSDINQRGNVGYIRVLEKNTSRNARQSWQVNWKEIPHIVTCEKRDLSDLSEFDETCYVVPKCENYPAIDSFGLVSKELFTNDAKDSAKWCLAGFQMTIAKQHPIVLQGLVDTRKRVLQLLAVNKTLAQQVEKEPFYVVFVVSSLAPYITKKQIEKSARQKMSFAVEQYSLELKDVAELVKYKIVNT